MKHKLLMKVQNFHKSQKQERNAVFWRILSQALRPLSKDLSNDMLRSIRAIVEERNPIKLLSWVDSLSTQMYVDRGMHFRANQFIALCKKYPYEEDQVLQLDPKGKAILSFRRSERKCRLMNEKMRAWNSRTAKTKPFFRELSSMRDFIAHAIGVSPMMDQILPKCDFGPGASIGVHGNATNIYRKITGCWSVTPSAYSYAFAAVLSNAQLRESLLGPEHPDSLHSLEDLDRAFRNRVVLVKSNKIEFVPKTAKIHRSIAIEPSLNSFVQKGVDNYMRLRLKRIGIDLSIQETNQNMARQGSYDDEDSFTTIDLSNASNSISRAVVQELLPPDWYEFLNSIRSKSYKLEDEENSYSMFCSMGNGFCFPLETLIFVSACHAVGCRNPGIDYRCYGDDIIVRKSKFDALVALLEFLGFSVNTEKTFCSGPFRESCGADWFEGEDVRPFTLDFRLDTLSNYFKFLNLVQRSPLCREFFTDISAFLIARIPSDLRFFRPYPGPADSGITVPFDQFLTGPYSKFLYRTRSWQWAELIAKPCADNLCQLGTQGGIASHVYAALRGSASAQPFTLRRKSRTKVRFITHPGATCMWLPA